jgi:HAD superfamily hydrolase (TIGR01484 family)
MGSFFAMFPHPLSLPSPSAFNAFAQVQGVLTDIDDTLTCAGALVPQAWMALQQLADAGVPVIAITGRPVGWSVPFAQTWPVRAIVAENGSVRLTLKNHQLQTSYLQPAHTRALHFQRLQQVLADIEANVTGAHRASDSHGRETDIAIDHSENHHLGPDAVAEVVHRMQAAGLKATVSSIHINGWMGTHDKWQGACWAVRELLDQELTDNAAQWVYVGDSTNDQVMFEHLPLTVGVANIRRFWTQLQHHPRFVTTQERGAGFSQVAHAVLAARNNLR